MPRWLVLAVMFVATSARADVPPVEGHVAFGGRIESTVLGPYDFSDDETPSARPSVDVFLGHRIGRVVVGLHAGGGATPLRYESKPLAASNEIVAYTTSTIYPVDLGLGAEITAPTGFWATAWLGASITFKHAHSPAAKIDAIDYRGDIPEASWSDRGARLGVGAGFGYDLMSNQYGRLGPLLELDYEAIGSLPLRYDDGYTGYEPDEGTCVSFTVALAYRY